MQSNSLHNDLPVRGRPRVRRTSQEKAIEVERRRQQGAERSRRLRERRLPVERSRNLTPESVQRVRIRYRDSEHDDEENEFQHRRNERNLQNQRSRRSRRNDSIQNRSNINENYLGEMNVLCTHCNAKHFVAEKVCNKGNSFNDCCGHGSIELDEIPDFPNNLRSYFDNNHLKSKEFFERIRNYNSTFSFASFNANLVDIPAVGRAPYCFKIQGQIYYQINEALYPLESENPKYGQLFIVDFQEAVDYRIRANLGSDREIMSELEQTLRQHNIFANSYLMMKEEIERQCQLTGGNSEPELQLLFSLKSGYDRNRYNLQRVNEVAAVFVTGADGDIPESYVTVRNKNSQILRSISSMDPIVEPMVYPLFYPHGSLGWHKNIMKKNKNSNRNEEANDFNDQFEQQGRHVTRCAYIKYRISIRPEVFNAFLLGRRLFQQWIVDSYVKVERDRIEYVRNNQKQLRIETYQGLVDHLNNKANDMNCQVGKMIILPSTFVGSPRYMMQNYQDAMAIVRSKGKPDLFITMTCNPNWREIRDNLLPGQQASDRPDLCARVFHLKKEQLLTLIVKEKYFGDVAAHVHVVEFQKRGLPHAHILVTLKYGHKLITVDEIDKFISAEIPDPENDSVLYDIVVRNMIHGPCDSRCLINNKCSKNYPKEFVEETVLTSDGYPHYKRRNNQRIVIRNNHNVDNRFVVPYCPDLLRIFNCHINVEVVSSVRSVKYLYKYVYKGYDAAHITIEESNNERVINHDEINSYIETRYVGPVEACYRILSKPLQSKSHSIVRLSVHLSEQQSIIIDDINDEVGVAASLNRSSTLLAYFELNKVDLTARQYIYTEIPTHYVYKKQNENGNKIFKWCKRKSRFNCIGRMYSVSPSKIELFRLRLILLHRKGATSFSDLLTVNGVQYQTFSETCLVLGLIENDDEWRHAMQEAISWMMPNSLRQLFVRILIHCNPVHPEDLWESFKDALSEDFLRLHTDSNKAYNLAYFIICETLIEEGHNIANFPLMPQIVVNNNIIKFYT